MINCEKYHNLSFDKSFYKLNKNNLGIEVIIKSKFSIIRETLERIGVINKTKKIVTPSCYIMKKDTKIYILHFKELLAFEGFENHIMEIDYLRRNRIATILEEWNHITIINKDYIFRKRKNETIKIGILPYSQKKFYTVNHKYIHGLPNKNNKKLKLK